MKKKILNLVKTPVKISKMPTVMGVVLAGALAVSLGMQLVTDTDKQDTPALFHHDSDFGYFLALQHAIHSDDHDAAPRFAERLASVDIPTVQTNIAISLFLAGKLDGSAAALAGDKSMTAQIAHAAWLVQQENWGELRRLYRRSDSFLLSPFRIWSGIATRYITETLRFIDSLPHGDDWRHFKRGMVFAETRQNERARQEFAKVPANFMTLNDYMYVMSFYTHAGFYADADDLKAEFAALPAGLYMQNFDEISDFSQFSGFRNAFAFSMVQNVAHSPFLSMTNIALLLLRAAEAASSSDALYFHIGSFFFDAGIDGYADYFAKIAQNSPYRPFIMMKEAERAPTKRKMMATLERTLRAHPVFLPAVLRLVNADVQDGNFSRARGRIDSALRHPDLSDGTAAILFTMRARINRQAGDLSRAQNDIMRAGDLMPSTPAILSEQAKIWTRMGKNLDDAYIIAMALVKKHPSDIDAWATTAMVVRRNEGPREALVILERIGRVAESNSFLFELLGDVHMDLGNRLQAREAYRKAMDLSSDGLTNLPELRRKLRRAR
ncbi:MAG: hypothetical protein FWE17_00150 [Alphaproteobacteria bacterium]|nr:hypothetical protein [Alphaproteobacteria bacterium]MCL2757816.1 hypothetical protein [Alphaproteobacteria bacterium]